MDVAKLALDIDATKATTATGKLRDMASAGGAAEEVFGSLGNTATRSVTQIAIIMGTAAVAFRLGTDNAGVFIDEMTRMGKELKAVDIGALTRDVEGLKEALTVREESLGIVNLFNRVKGLISGGIGGLADDQLKDLKDRFENALGTAQIAKINEITRGMKDQIDVIGKSAPEALAIQGGAIERELVQKYRKAGASIEEAERKAKSLAGALTAAKQGDSFDRASRDTDSQINALTFQTRALTATKLQAIDLDLAQKKLQISTSQLARDYPELARQLLNAADAAAQAKKANEAISSGGAAVKDFQSTFGVQFDFDTKATGDALASKFAVVFNRFKGDRNAQVQLSQAFESLVRQALEQGVPDIPELLSDKLGPSASARLIADLGPDLQAALDASRQAGQQWGSAFRSELSDTARAFGDIGKAADDMEAQTRGAMQRVLADVSNTLNAIPDVTRKSIVFDVFYAMSPQRPFSEFLPRMGREFGNLATLVNNSTPEILFNVPDLSAKIRQIEELNQSINRDRLQGATITAQGNPGLANYQRKALFQQATQKTVLLEQLQSDLEFEIARASYSAQAGAGGRGGDTYVFNAGSATFNAMTLDDALLQWERTLIRVTGKDPQIRVTS